jgi:cardiolipin synthase
MIAPLNREEVLDLTRTPLGPGWLRRAPTSPESKEIAGPTVWRTGPLLRFRDALAAALEGAQEVALVSSFLLAEERLADAMLSASKKGVRVYVLTASEQRIGKMVAEDESLEQRMAEQHQKLLERLAGKVLLRSASHIHAKFLVVDPQIPASARAWLSTANFNKALSDSLELGVMLDAAGAAALAACFHWGFWCEADHELRGLRRLVEVKPLHPAAPPRPIPRAVVATLKNGTALRERVLALIEGAQRELLVASYGMAADHSTVRALMAAARDRGVHVTVITRPRPAVAAAAATLAAAGVSVVAHDKLHAKAISADGQVLVMSANLEAQGLDQGYEIGALLSDESARGVTETLREWMAAAPWVYRADASRGDHLGEFCPAGARPRDGMAEVIQVLSQSLPAVVAKDALRLKDADAPPLRPSPPGGKLPRQVQFSWQVQPPTLPKGAREQFQEVEREEAAKGGTPKKVKVRQPFDPPVFEHGGEKLVVLRQDADVNRVKSAADDIGARVVLP